MMTAAIDNLEMNHRYGSVTIVTENRLETVISNAGRDTGWYNLQ